MNDSEIIITWSSITYAGPDATAFLAVRMLRSSINLYMKTGIIPTRGVTISRMLAAAGQRTGKKYKRGQAAQAVADLDTWIATMAAALPVTVDGAAR
jgi:hypothetical protein